MAATATRQRRQLQRFSLQEYEELLKEIVARLVATFHPYQIRLFGSYAKGNAREGSDIDLVMVMDSHLTPAQRRAQASEIVGISRIPIDILVYTPEEIQAKLDKDDFFLMDIFEHSKVLYEVVGFPPFERRNVADVWRRMSRPKVDQEMLDGIVNCIVTTFHPHKIILFGHYAKGDAREDDDIELLVILDSQERMVQRIRNIRSVIDETRVGIRILVYTPQEIKQRFEMSDGFLKEIVESGYVLYEHCHD